jgi:RNA polymerase sigma factor (sigma-70 family)
MSHVCDSDLLEELKDGNQKAFDLLFLKYYKLLLANAYSMVLDENEAKDIVQCFFMDIWDKKIYLDLHDDVRGYFCRSIHNRCINSLQKAAAIKKKQTEIFAAADEGYGEEPYYSEQLHIDLAVAMSDMPVQKKEALRLVYMQDKRYLEAAQDMGISVNSLKTHLKSGLKILRKKLGGD